MPIRIIVRNNERRIPVVFCDYCGKEISQPGEGDVEWRVVDFSDARFTHKHCSKAFREAQPYVHQSMELGEFLKRLIRTLQPN